MRLPALLMALRGMAFAADGDEPLATVVQAISNHSHVSHGRLPTMGETQPPVWQKGITYTHLYHHSNNLLSGRSLLSLKHVREQLHAE